MLSIAVIKSSAAAVSYYEKDDYYAGSEEGPDSQGQWYGKGAEKLGLHGAVDREGFKEILDGKLPNGETLGVIKGGERQHTPGWDMTFSAPKSVTLLAELGGDERILEAHNLAVRAAFDWVEKEAATTRQSGFSGIENVQTGNLAAALFQHDTNRNQDPQLHTHAVVINATQRKDHAWRSVHSKPLFDHKMASGNAYRAELALQLQSLGYEIERTHNDGRFEIAGVDQAVIDAFSTRRADIEAAMATRGLEGAEAAAQAALRTRESKQAVDRDSLSDSWRERAASLGFDATDLSQAAQNRGDVRSDVDGNSYLDAAIERLSEREAAFSHSKLVQWVLAEGMGKINVSDTETLIKNASTGESAKLHQADLAGVRSWTTERALQHERAIESAVSAGRRSQQPVMPGRQVRDALNGSPLNKGQRQAVQLLLSSKDQFNGVLGRPGTGKTFMLNNARELLERNGMTVVGMASNAEAARQLEDDASIPSGTIASHIASVQRELRQANRIPAPQAKKIYQSLSNQFWVVDEASQVDNRDMKQLTGLAERFGVRMAFIGDPQQLGAIDAGKPFARMLQRGLRHVEMDEIRRQTDDEHVSAIRSAIAGDVPAALRTLDDQIREESDEGNRFRALVDAWRGLGVERDKTLVLTARNESKHQLNDAMREVMRREGKLQNETAVTQLDNRSISGADRKVAESYRLGDLIRFNQDVAGLGTKSGEYWKVVSADSKTNELIIELNGRRVSWNPKLQATAERATTPYRPRESTAAPGERIVWQRNDRDLGLNNGQQLIVKSVSAESMTVETNSGKSVDIPIGKRQGQHWSHGYATTVYKSQGKTADRVLVNADTKDKQLYSQKAFLVAISRQKNELTFFTDDKDKFGRQVQEHVGDKTSAIEARDDSLWSRLDKALAAGRSFARESRESKAVEKVPLER